MNDCSPLPDRPKGTPDEQSAPIDVAGSSNQVLEKLRSVPQRRVAINLDLTATMVNRDRVHRILHEHADWLDGKSDVWTPLSLVVALGATVAATKEFSDTLIPADSWRVVFILALVLSAAWVVWRIVQYVRSPNQQEIVDGLASEIMEPKPTDR